MVSFWVVVRECSDVERPTAVVKECSDVGRPRAVVKECSDVERPTAVVTWDALAMYHLHLNFHQ